MNVGFQGQSRSNADITEPSLLTEADMASTSMPNKKASGDAGAFR
jgi:hypothetical protein